MKFLCCLVLGIASCMLASAQAGFPPVREATLPNGLVVLIAPDSLASAVDVRGAGSVPASRYEPPGQSGARTCSRA